MNHKSYQEIKEFISELIIYIRPEATIEDSTPIGILRLDDIDFTMIAIEIEEKYKIIVDEKTLSNIFFFHEMIEYIVSLINENGTVIHNHPTHV
jgi:acyl carrier protein